MPLQNPLYEVAVYGTLRKGAYNHRLLKGSRCIGRATVRGYLYDFGPFPLFVEYKKLDIPSDVAVEIYEVSKETLARLDRLEGYDASNLSLCLYRRRIVHPIGYGKPVIIYEWNKPVDERDTPRILSGDWFKR